MKTFITAAATLVALSSVSAAPTKRDTSTIHAYSQVVDGLNAAVGGSDYLTYHQLNGYDIASCQNFCNTDSGDCHSFNIFREFGTNDSSDPVYKCTLWNKTHKSSDATNVGGQDQGHGSLTKIEWSQIQTKGSQYQGRSLPGAILASSQNTYMGTRSIGWGYDPAACANACDQTSGCNYANLWQGWTQANGNSQPTCALFGSASSTQATNVGDGTTYVTNSWLYTKSD